MADFIDRQATLNAVGLTTDAINFNPTKYVDAQGNELVAVVRCKDCKHREVQVDGVFRYEMCGIRSEIINLDGFCHMGKRREDAETD